jgi:hypothetical protein
MVLSSVPVASVRLAPGKEKITQLINVFSSQRACVTLSFQIRPLKNENVLSVLLDHSKLKTRIAKTSVRR